MKKSEKFKVTHGLCTAIYSLRRLSKHKNGKNSIFLTFKVKNESVMTYIGSDTFEGGLTCLVEEFSKLRSHAPGLMK